MPKLPIHDAARPATAVPALSDRPVDTGLPAGAKGRLAQLAASDDAVERTRAVSESLLAARRALYAAETEPAEIRPGFAESFVAEIDRAHAETLRSTSVDRRPELKAELDVVRDDFIGLAAEAEAAGKALRRRLALRDVLDANAELVRLDGRALDGAVGRVDALINALELPPARREALRSHIRLRLGNAALDGLLDDPADAQAALTSGRFNDYLDDRARAAWSEEVTALLERQQVQAAANGMLVLLQQAKAGALDTTALDAAVAEGRIGRTDAALLRSMDANARAEADARRAGVQRVATSDGPLDPDNPDDQAAVDAYWETVRDGFASDDPALTREAELYFVRLKGILPSALRRKYEGLLLSTDPALVASGAEAVAALKSIDPELTRDMAPDRLRLAAAVTGFANLGLMPQEAVARARDDVARDEAAPEEVPGLFGDIAAPFRAVERAAPGIDVGIGATDAVDRGLTDRVFRTSREFAAFLRELQGLSPDEAVERARTAGLAGNLGQIALEILDAANREGDTREAQLQAVERTIDQLPNLDAARKRRLKDLLASARGILDDPELLADALAVNRDLFRGQPRLASIDLDALEAQRFASFREETGLIARPATATLTPQQGDPDDLAEVVTRDLAAGEDVETSLGGRIRRIQRRIAFFRRGSDTPFVTLPESAANALMTRPEKAAERLDFIAKWQSGELAGDDLIAAARGIFIDDQGHSLVLGGGDIINREAFDAFLEAKDRIEAGEDADAVLAALMPSLIPGAFLEASPYVGLVLDVLPIIGDVRAAAQVLSDIRKYQTAKATGDKEGQKEALTGIVVGTLTLIPFAGFLFKNVRIATKNFLRDPLIARELRSNPRLKKLHGRLLLPRFLKDVVDEASRAKPHEVFREIWPGLSKDQRKLVRGMFYYLKGQSIENDLAEVLTNAGFTLVKNRAGRIVSIRGGKRIFDHATDEEFSVFFNTFVFPRKNGKGTAFEDKLSGARRTKKQDADDKAIIKKISKGEEVTTLGEDATSQVSIKSIRLFQVPIGAVPEDRLIDLAREKLMAHVDGSKSERLTNQQVNLIVESLRRWHAEARRTPAVKITLAQAFLMIGKAANGYAEINQLGSDESGLSEPLGA